MLEQRPAGGTHARKGTTVTIVVGELAPDHHPNHSRDRRLHDQHRSAGTSLGRSRVARASGRASRVDALTVAVLAGGRSSEHDVSLASGAAIREGLLMAGHEVTSIEIARDGTWRAGASP